MDLAQRHRERLQGLLDPATAAYPFEDRVLLMIAPYWRSDVEGFHVTGASSLQQSHDPHKLRRFDEHYLDELQRVLAANS